MKRICSFLLALFSMAAFFMLDAYACDENISSLKERYRKAESIFVGTVESLEAYPKGRNWTLDGFNAYTVRFKTTKTWKGGEDSAREYVVMEASCGCPDMSIMFKQEKEYLVFAPEEDLVICNAVATDTKRAEEEMKKLNRFWFRTWATVFPF